MSVGPGKLPPDSRFRAVPRPRSISLASTGQIGLPSANLSNCALRSAVSFRCGHPGPAALRSEPFAPAVRRQSISVRPLSLNRPPAGERRGGSPTSAAARPAIAFIAAELLERIGFARGPRPGRRHGRFSEIRPESPRRGEFHFAGTVGKRRRFRSNSPRRTIFVFAGRIGAPSRTAYERRICFI
jgi:hypothetical protein